MTETDKKKKKKSVGHYISITVMALSIILLSYTLIMKLSNRTPRLFGYSFHVVVTASMEPEIMTYDFIVAQKASIDEIEEGDYLVFVSPDPLLKKRTIVHRINSIYEKDGVKMFVTQGIANDEEDNYHVPESNVVGIYSGKSVVLSAVVRSVIHAAIYLLNHIHVVFIIFISIMGIIVVLLSLRVFKLLKAEKAAKAQESETLNEPTEPIKFPEAAEQSEPLELSKTAEQSEPIKFPEAAEQSEPLELSKTAEPDKPTETAKSAKNKRSTKTVKPDEPTETAKPDEPSSKPE